MDKRTLLNIINQISQIIIDKCETNEEVEQVKEGIEKYIDFSKIYFSDTVSTNCL